MNTIDRAGTARVWMRGAVFLALLAAVALVVAPEVGAAPTDNDKVALEFVEESAHQFAAESSGDVQVYAWNQAEGYGVVMLRVQMPTTWEGFYALYSFNETEGRRLITRFNPGNGKYTNWIGFWADASVWATEDITFEVWFELDDGIESPDLYDDWVILRGHLDRP